MDDRKSSGQWERSERVLNDAEIGLLSEHASALPTLLTQYDIQPEDVLSPRSLDELFMEWNMDASSARASNPDLLAAIGISLGNYLCVRFDMQWVALTDKQGTTYAVRHKSKRIHCFPIESIKKRVGHSEYGFIVAIVESISKALSDPSRRDEIADL